MTENLQSYSFIRENADKILAEDISEILIGVRYLNSYLGKSVDLFVSF